MVARDASGDPRPSRANPLAGKNPLGYLWATLAFLGFSILGHWTFGWFAYVNEAREHGVPIEGRDYLVEMARDTFENWQSEFLQLVWQVGGLAVFLYVGSPQSKEGHDRLEAKIDYLMSRTDEGARKQEQIDHDYLRDA